MAKMLVSGCVNFGGSVKSRSMYSGFLRCSPEGQREEKEEEEEEEEEERREEERRGEIREKRDGER